MSAWLETEEAKAKREYWRKVEAERIQRGHEAFERELEAERERKILINHALRRPSQRVTYNNSSPPQVQKNKIVDQFLGFFRKG